MLSEANSLSSGQFSPVSIRKLILALIFSIVANAFEDRESWSTSCVRVYVKDVSSLDLLEESHCRESLVVLHHLHVLLSFSNVMSWVLENAAGTIRTLARMVQEVLTYRCEVLSAESLFLLQFFLSMCESASLLLKLVITVLSH